MRWTRQTRRCGGRSRSGWGRAVGRQDRIFASGTGTAMAVPVVVFLSARDNLSAYWMPPQAKDLQSWRISCLHTQCPSQGRIPERLSSPAWGFYPPIPSGVLCTSWCLLIIRHYYKPQGSTKNARSRTGIRWLLGKNWRSHHRYNPDDAYNLPSTHINLRMGLL